MDLEFEFQRKHLFRANGVSKGERGKTGGITAQLKCRGNV